MPFLKRLRSHCLWARLQDQTGQGRSSDGEFIYNNSLLPPGERPLVFAYPGNLYFGLPALLHEARYYTLYAVPYSGLFWNCRTMSGRYGFRHHLVQEDFDPPGPGEKTGWGLSDQAIFSQMIPRLQKLPRPFYAYVVTLMSHHPYAEIPPDKEPLRLPKRLSGTLLKNYLNCCRLRDSQVEQIVSNLKISGLWDNTIVVFFGDHDARIPNHEMALLQTEGLGAAGTDGTWRYDAIDKILHDQVPCLIHCPGDSPRGPLPQDSAQIDLPPTLLSLLGVDGSSSCFLGSSLLKERRPPRSRVSKGGYSLNADQVLLEEDGEFKTFRLSDRKVFLGDCTLRQDTLRWSDLAADLLRLDLVGKVRTQRF